jgi:hypothetical protein
MDLQKMKNEMEEAKKKLEVSKEFVETYKYLNAGDMTDAIIKLSELERYLLVTLSLDNHDIKSHFVRHNLLPLKEIGQHLYDAMEEHVSDNKIIEKLIQLTGDKYIDLSVLVDPLGNEMPEPANQSEAREYKLRFID